MKAKFYICILIAACVCILAVTGAWDVLSGAAAWLNASAEKGNYVRGIGTNQDLWFNGYLGMFLNFKMIGWHNWSGIPLSVWFLLSIRRRARWQVAVFTAVICSTLFLSVKGYVNFRYLLTLFPLWTTLIALFGWEILRKKSRWVSACVFTFLICLLIGNIYNQKDMYKYYYNSATGNGIAGERFPWKMIEYINDKMPDGTVIKEKNLPWFYYYTDKKSPSDKRAPAKYMLVRGESLKDYTLIAEDQGYRLYEKREPESTESLLRSIAEQKPVFQTQFSSLENVSPFFMSDLNKVLSPMVFLGGKNKFRFRQADAKGILRIEMPDGEFNKLNRRSKIQFGYDNRKNGFNLNCTDGDIVYFVINIRHSGGTIIQAFIQDKTDYWLREKIFLRGRQWQTLVVKKRIRSGAKKISMGVYWEPLSEVDWMEIKSIKVYVQKSDI